MILANSLDSGSVLNRVGECICLRLWCFPFKEGCRVIADLRRRIDQAIRRLRSGWILFDACHHAASSPLTAAAADLQALCELAEEDASLQTELEAELRAFEKRLGDFELRSRLTGLHDAAPPSSPSAPASMTRNAVPGRRCWRRCTPTGPRATVSASPASAHIQPRWPASIALRCTSRGYGRSDCSEARPASTGL